MEKALYPIKKDDLWGYIDAEGRVQISPRFAWAGPFQYDRAAARPAGDYRTGYINTAGDFVGEVEYNSDRPYSEGLAPVTRAAFEESERGYFYIDLTGKRSKKIKEIYADARPFSDGLAAVKRGDLWGYINKKGEVVIDFAFQFSADFSEGVARVSYPDKQKWHYINKSGALVTGGSFVRGENLHEGLIAVERAESWGFIDKKGDWAIEPAFQWVGSFNGGLAPARFKDKYGFIDTKGDFVINPVFDFAGNFYDERAPVKQGPKWGFLDPSGEYVIAPQFDQVDLRDGFSRGLARVVFEGQGRALEKGEWQYIDRDGNIVYQGENKYSRVSPEDYFALAGQKVLAEAGVDPEPGQDPKPDLELELSLEREKGRLREMVAGKEARRKKFFSRELLQTPLIAVTAAAFALYGTMVTPFFEFLQGVRFALPWFAYNIMAALVCGYIGYRVGIVLERIADPKGDFRLLFRPENILAAGLIGFAALWAHFRAPVAQFLDLSDYAVIFLCFALAGLRAGAVFRWVALRVYPVFNPEIPHMRLRKAPGDLRDEVLRLKQEKPAHRWAKANDFGPILISLPLALAGLVGGAFFWHFEMNRRMGTLTADFDFLLIPLILALLIFPLIFSVFHYLRTLGRNAYLLTSRGLARLEGRNLTVFPYKMIVDMDTSFGVRPTFYFDPVNGRSSLFYSEEEKRRRSMGGLPEPVAYQHFRGPASATLYIPIEGNSSSEKIFFSDDRLEAMADFRAELRKRIDSSGEPDNFTPLIGSGWKPRRLIRRFVNSLPLVILCACLGMIYVVLPAHNRGKDEAYARIYLFDNQAQKYENLTDKLSHLKDYWRFFKGGRFHKDVTRHLPEVLEVRIKEMRKDMLRSKNGKFSKKSVYRGYLADYDSITGLNRFRWELNLLSYGGDDIRRWLRENRAPTLDSRE